MKVLYPIVHALILITVSHSTAGQEGEPFSWTVGTCGRAMEMLWNEEGERKHPAEGAPVVRVDVGGDFVLDTRIFLYRDKDKVHAEILQVPEAPVCVQLEGLHDSGRYPTLEGAVDAIRLSKRTVDSSRVPALGKVYGKLDSLAVDLDPPDTLYLPSRGYGVLVEGVAGSVRVDLSVPEESADKVVFSGSGDLENEELLSWLDKLFQVLEVSLVPERESLPEP